MSDDKFVRYSLKLDRETFEKIQAISEDEGNSMLTIFRRFIQVGLVVWEDNDYYVAYQKPGSDKLERVLVL